MPGYFDEYQASHEYDIKQILWNNRETAIVMQNINGACPLIALVNVLVLSDRVCSFVQSLFCKTTFKTPFHLPAVSASLQEVKI